MPTEYDQRVLDQIADLARRLGLGEEGARVAVSIAITEGGISGAVGDQGQAFGPFQFHREGMLPAFARDKGVSLDQAGELARRDQLAAAEWALRGYLGQAIRAGQAKGLSGPELATYAQQYGQRSQRPETAGQRYAHLFGATGGGGGKARAQVAPRSNPDPFNQSPGERGQMPGGQAEVPPPPRAESPRLRNLRERHADSQKELQAAKAKREKLEAAGEERDNAGVLTSNAQRARERLDEADRLVNKLRDEEQQAWNQLAAEEDKANRAPGPVTAPSNQPRIISRNPVTGQLIGELNPNYQAPDPDIAAANKATARTQQTIAEMNLAEKKALAAARDRADAAWKQYGQDGDQEKLMAALAAATGDAQALIRLYAERRAEQRARDQEARQERQYAATFERQRQEGAQAASERAITTELAERRTRLGPTFAKEFAENLANFGTGKGMRWTPEALSYEARPLKEIGEEAFMAYLKKVSPYEAQILATGGAGDATGAGGTAAGLAQYSPRSAGGDFRPPGAPGEQGVPAPWDPYRAAAEAGAPLATPPAPPLAYTQFRVPRVPDDVDQPLYGY